MDDIPPESPASGAREPSNGDRQPLEPGMYLAVSAGGLAVSVGLLLLLVFGSDRIMAAGLDHRVFYVLLVPLGLSGAAFVFGAMKSRAIYRESGAREVTLTGPAFFAALVVVGGFFLVPDSGLRALAVRVDSEPAGGPVAGARIILDWGPQRLVQVTDASGQASFLGLPPGTSALTVGAEADGHAAVQRTLEEIPANGVVRITLPVRADSLRVAGTVIDREARQPVEGVILSFASGAAVDTTDALGNFGVLLLRPTTGRVVVIGTLDGSVGLNTEVPVQAETPLTLFLER